MKKIITIVTFGLETQPRQIFFDKFEKFTPREVKKMNSSSQLALEAETVEVSEAIAFLNEHKQQYWLFQHYYYTKKELESIPYFLMVPSYPLELEGTTVKNYGTTYDNACPLCGLGGDRIGDVLIDRKLVRKTHFGNILPEIIVSEEAKDIVEKNMLSGISFSSMVKDYRGREMLPFYVADISSILPPVSQSTWLDVNDNSCPNHFRAHLNSDLEYESEKLEGAMDFNLTYEFFDTWEIRYLVISAKARKVFMENDLRFRYKPVHLIK